ncbi:hypothetical protein LTR22_027860 [Elasticomyces elasticus]|nr:hypothetical protein LTR22_027860 [Elasticomyces elasticus]
MTSSILGTISTIKALDTTIKVSLLERTREMDNLETNLTKLDEKVHPSQHDAAEILGNFLLDLGAQLKQGNADITNLLHSRTKKAPKNETTVPQKRKSTATGDSPRDKRRKTPPVSLTTELPEAYNNISGMSGDEDMDDPVIPESPLMQDTPFFNAQKAKGKIAVGHKVPGQRASNKEVGQRNVAVPDSAVKRGTRSSTTPGPGMPY